MTMRRSLLAGLALLGGALADGPAGACAADGECDADAAAYLQHKSGSGIIQVVCSGKGPSAIKANDCDSCPGGSCNSKDCQWMEPRHPHQPGMCTDRPKVTCSGAITAPTCASCPGNACDSQDCEWVETWHSQQPGMCAAKGDPTPSPTPPPKVNCGAWTVSSCPECKFDQSGQNLGPTFCHGDCTWSYEKNECTLATWGR